MGVAPFMIGRCRHAQCVSQFVEKHHIPCVSFAKKQHTHRANTGGVKYDLLVPVLVACEKPATEIAYFRNKNEDEMARLRFDMVDSDHRWWDGTFGRSVDLHRSRIFNLHIAIQERTDPLDSSFDRAIGWHLPIDTYWM